jgi:ABC-type dipeptide/oligopeptide/nickel transport system ATPase component
MLTPRSFPRPENTPPPTSSQAELGKAGAQFATPSRSPQLDELFLDVEDAFKIQSEQLDSFSDALQNAQAEKPRPLFSGKARNDRPSSATLAVPTSKKEAFDPSSGESELSDFDDFAEAKKNEWPDFENGRPQIITKHPSTKVLAGLAPPAISANEMYSNLQSAGKKAASVLSKTRSDALRNIPWLTRAKEADPARYGLKAELDTKSQKSGDKPASDTDDAPDPWDTPEEPWHLPDDIIAKQEKEVKFTKLDKHLMSIDGMEELALRDLGYADDFESDASEPMLTSDAISTVPTKEADQAIGFEKVESEDIPEHFVEKGGTTFFDGFKGEYRNSVEKYLEKELAKSRNNMAATQEFKSAIKEKGRKVASTGMTAYANLHALRKDPFKFINQNKGTGIDAADKAMEKVLFPDASLSSELTVNARTLFTSAKNEIMLLLQGYNKYLRSPNDKSSGKTDLEIEVSRAWTAYDKKLSKLKVMLTETEVETAKIALEPYIDVILVTYALLGHRYKSLNKSEEINGKIEKLVSSYPEDVKDHFLTFDANLLAAAEPDIPDEDIEQPTLAIKGASGSGKTSIITEILKLREAPYIVINEDTIINLGYGTKEEYPYYRIFSPKIDQFGGYTSDIIENLGLIFGELAKVFYRNTTLLIDEGEWIVPDNERMIKQKIGNNHVQDIVLPEKTHSLNVQRVGIALTTNKSIKDSAVRTKLNYTIQEPANASTRKSMLTRKIEEIMRKKNITVKEKGIEKIDLNLLDNALNRFVDYIVDETHPRMEKITYKPPRSFDVSYDYDKKSKKKQNPAKPKPEKKEATVRISLEARPLRAMINGLANDFISSLKKTGEIPPSAAVHTKIDTLVKAAFKMEKDGKIYSLEEGELDIRDEVGEYSDDNSVNETSESSENESVKSSPEISENKNDKDTKDRPPTPPKKSGGYDSDTW